MALNSLSNSFNANNTGGRSSGSSGPLIKSKSLGTLLIFLIILLAVFSIIMIGIAVSFPKRVDSKDSNEEVLLNFIHNCKNNPLEISTKSISASSSGNEYSLTFWFFINDLDSNYLKDSSYPHLDILTKGLVNPAVNGINTDRAQPIKVYLDRKSNTMRVDLKDVSSQADMSNVAGCYDYTPGPALSLVSMPADKNTVDACSVETLRLNNNYFGMDSQNKCYYMNNGDILDLDNKGFTKVASITDKFNCFQNEVLESKLKGFQGNYGGSKTAYNGSKSLENVQSVNAEINKILGALNSVGGSLPDNYLSLKFNIDTAKSDFDSFYNEINRLVPIIGIDLEEAPSVLDENAKTKASEFFSKYTSDVSAVTTIIEDSKSGISGVTNQSGLTTALTTLKNNLETALVSKFDSYYPTIDALFGASTTQDRFYIGHTEMASSDSPCRVEQVPIQRWNCITLNVHNNIADLFMDGKLLHTCVHSNNILLNNDPIMIGNRGGFDGYVSNVTWSTKALGADEIYERYSRGPRIRLTVNDRIKYMFMKKPKDIEASEEAIDYVNQESTGRL